MKRIVWLALVLAAPSVAQTLPTDPTVLNRRVGSLEKQMQAVQRKVFPGGDPKFFTPEISAEAPPPAAPVGTPSTSVLTDLSTRVGALEGQIRMMTGQIEETQFKLRQLDEALTKMRGDTEFRLNAIEGPAPKPPGTADIGASPAPGDANFAPPLGDALAAAPPPPKPAAPVPATPEAKWRAAYALYAAKDFPGAETAMADFLKANPKAPQVSKAQYWLGRTYMEQGAHAQAAKAFLDGYQKYPKGERAPDSLLWLGNALAALRKPDQACRALNELQSVYGEKLTPALKTAATKARTGAKCEA